MTTEQLFPLGQVVMTAGVNNWIMEDDGPGLREFRVLGCIHRHQSGDWGTVDAEDKVANDDAVKSGDRILSAYNIGGTKIWIITEWDRSATTVLFPDEY